MTTPALLHPFAVPAREHFVEIVAAEGVRVRDATGRAYIDAIGSLWYCAAGHGRREIADAVADQLRTLDAFNTFERWTNGPAEQLADRIRSLSPLDDGRVFLCSSGSEAVDTAIKLARAVAVRRGEPERQVIVRRDRAYHGATIGGTSTQGLPANRRGWGDLLAHVEEIDADDVESAARLFADHGHRVAAVLCEPVQGAGGVHPPAPGYLEGLRRLCDDHGALLVFDEVITGFGRTGEWFAAQTYGVTPDLITFAKSVTSGYQPLGGVICGRSVCDVLEADPDAVLRHGHTYSGHPAACAAALANIELLDREGLVARARHIGRRFAAGFDALVADGVLRSHRGVGALWGARLAGGGDAVAVRDAMIDEGVIARGVGDAVLFCPPLVIDDADLDTCIDVMARCAGRAD